MLIQTVYEASTFKFESFELQAIHELICYTFKLVTFRHMYSYLFIQGLCLL